MGWYVVFAIERRFSKLKMIHSYLFKLFRIGKKWERYETQKTNGFWIWIIFLLERGLFSSCFFVCCSFVSGLQRSIINLILAHPWTWRFFTKDRKSRRYGGYSVIIRSCLVINVLWARFFQMLCGHYNLLL